MLIDCGYTTSLVSDMKRGQMPSADKIFKIADYLEVSAYFLMGETDDPIPPKKNLTQEEKLLSEIYKLTPDKYKQAEEFIKFLKTQQDFSQELSDSIHIPRMKPQQE